MWTNVQFWKDATWRAFRTFCQTLASLFAGQAANILSAPWSSLLSVSAGAALISLLQSIDRERAIGAVETVPASPSQPVVTEVTACGDALR